MNNLVDSINDIIDIEYPKISKKEKALLSKISTLNVLHLDYYKDRYYSFSIATMNNRNYNFISNRIESLDIHSKILEENSSYSLDSSDIEKFKEIIINDEVYQIFSKFKDIITENSSCVDYIKALSDENKNNSDFITTLFNYSHLLQDLNFSQSFFHKYVLFKLIEESNTKLYSEKTKNTIYLNSVLNPLQDNTENFEQFLKQWNLYNEYNKTKFIENFELFTSLKFYNNKYSKKIENIMNKVLEERDFLIKPFDINKVEFFYYEAKQNNPLKLETNFNFSEELLNKNNIKVSPVYEKLKNFNEESEETHESLLRKQVSLLYNNDLPAIYPGVFYGLDYINALQQGTLMNRQVLYAVYHNEIIGSISYDSQSDNPYSTIKNMAYVFVKDNFRGKGLSKMFYQKTANLFIENNNILTNSMYSLQGGIKLPKLKQKIREENPDFLMLDTDFGNIGENDSKTWNLNKLFYRDFNDYFINILNKSEKKKKITVSQNIDFFRQFYKDKVNEFLNLDINFEKGDYFSEAYNFINTTIELLSKEIDKIELKTHLKDKQELKNKKTL